MNLVKKFLLFIILTCLIFNYGNNVLACYIMTREEVINEYNSERERNFSSLRTDDGKEYLFKLLYCASFYNLEEIVKKLVERGANPNLPLILEKENEYGEREQVLKDVVMTRTLLNRNIDLFNFLIYNGGDVNAGEHCEYGTPLHIACLYGDFDLVTRLITMGSNIDAIDNLGNRPLYNSIMSKNLLGKGQVIDLLVRLGSDINFMDTKRETMLHKIIGSYEDEDGIDISAVKLLLKMKINTSIRNIEGKSALDLALSRRQQGFSKENIIRILIDR